jgi:CRISPR/Cas system-associated endonuclease Cas3-HD
MSDYLQVKDHPNLVREIKSKAIINTDTKALKQYLDKKALLLEKEQKIDNLEKDIKDMKNILQQILEKIDK